MAAFKRFSFSEVLKYIVTKSKPTRYSCAVPSIESHNGHHEEVQTALVQSVQATVNNCKLTQIPASKGTIAIVVVLDEQARFGQLVQRCIVLLLKAWRRKCKPLIVSVPSTPQKLLLLLCIVCLDDLSFVEGHYL